MSARTVTVCRATASARRRAVFFQQGLGHVGADGDGLQGHGIGAQAGGESGTGGLHVGYGYVQGAVAHKPKRKGVAVEGFGQHQLKTAVAVADGAHAAVFDHDGGVGQAFAGGGIGDGAFQ
jgi:hypothetical protein